MTPEPGRRCSRAIELPSGASTEKTIAELAAGRRDQAARRRLSPHPEIDYIQQKFSFPVACLVFAIIGLALGLTVARDGKLAGFVVGIAVIFAYYIVMFLAESHDQGALPGHRGGQGRRRPAS